MRFILTVLVMFSVSPLLAQLPDNKITLLDEAAVTIKADGGQGSGSIINKEMVVDDKGTKENVTFVLTAAHVVEGNRNVQNHIVGGIDKKYVEFSDVGILQEIYYKGRRVGEIKFDAKVVKYSDAKTGHDIALLMLYAPNRFPSQVEFVKEKDYIPPKGMRVVHIGSSNGQVGSNSFTTGNISQTGRVLGNIGGGGGVVFDQTSAPAEGGSSGCMIVREKDGKYVGMLVRGGSSTFNFIVPVRRIHEWADENGCGFLFHDDKVPTKKELLEQPIEEGMRLDVVKEADHLSDKKFPYLLGE